MLTTLSYREVETYGVAETTEFSIKANGKAFKVLIDGLYSDKIRAVIREIWSNAYDSHIAAGKPDVPFDCHLPTVWEPYFSVRDYGVSLSHHDVMRLYTTVFESSKEDTNTQVGKLGLGSKSPFAYTDTFTVTAWLDGEKRMYSAYIGEDYIPRISLMSAEESEEPQGLEISFPVKSDDVYDFRIAAQRTALGFDVLPNIVGSDPIKKATRDVLAEGAGWKLYTTSDYGLRAHAKQGCVIYPIDPTAVVGLTLSQASLLKSCLFIDFPIGDLEITASREGLGYDEQTCKNIIARLETIETEITTQIEAKFTSAKTWHEALLLANELRSSDIPESVRKLIDQVKWKGKGLPKTIYLDTTKLRGVEVVKYHSGVMTRRRSLKKHASRGSFYIDPGNTRVYFHRSDAAPVPSALERIQLHWQTEAGSPDVLIVRAMPDSIGFKRFLVALGRIDPETFVDVTALPKVPKDASAHVRNPVKVREYDHHYSDPKQWNQVDATGGVYVDIERSELKDNAGHKIDAWTIKKVRESLIACGALTEMDPVYIVPKTLIKTTRKPGWTNLFDLADRVLLEKYDETLAQRLWTLDRFFELTSSYGSGVPFATLFKIWVRDGVALPPGAAGHTVTFMNVLADEARDLEIYRGPMELAQARGKFTPPPGDPLKLLLVDEKDLSERYPMLKLVLENCDVSDINSMDKKVLVDYVTLIDSAAS